MLKDLDHLPLVVLRQEEADKLIKAAHTPGNETTSEEFLKWYNEPKGYFPLQKGIMLIMEVDTVDLPVVASFDFTNPERPVFSLFMFKTGAMISQWYLRRSENKMQDGLKIRLTYQAEKYLRKGNHIVPHHIQQRIYSLIDRKLGLDKDPFAGSNYAKVNGRVQDLTKLTAQDIFREVNVLLCEAITLTCYCLMYHMAHKKMANITNASQRDLGEIIGYKEGTYKYDGFIKIEAQQVYQPFTDEDTMFPTKTYERHIEAWHTSGHYRRLRDGSYTWVSAHIKGKGKIEERTYGFNRPAGLPEKIFPVQKVIRNREWFSYEKKGKKEFLLLNIEQTKPIAVFRVKQEFNQVRV